MDVAADWRPFERVERLAPPALRSWLAEPGLLTARIRALFGDRMRFRMLGPLRVAQVPDELQRRLGLREPSCLLREIEFCCDAERVVYAQTVLPDATLDAHPWLRELGDSPIGETLRRADAPLDREPLEYASLPLDSALALAACADSRSASGDALWARRAVYRLGGRPMLVQEVFLPALLRAADPATGSRTTS